MKPVAAIVEPLTPAEMEQLRALIAEHREKSPIERATIAHANRERKKALRSRDAHRARIKALLAMLPEDKRAQIIAELEIDLASWSETPAPTRVSPIVPAPPIPVGQSVYFVQGVAGGPIKIGTSSDVADRVRTLQCASPVLLQVIGVVAGDQRLEQVLHRRLTSHRLHGEWFADVPEVRAAIAEVLQ